MTTVIVDRRDEPVSEKFRVDRQLFRERYKKIIREAVRDKIVNDSIEDFGKDGVTVPIPPETLEEPTIRHGQGGVFRRVFPGNLAYDVGDKIPKPPPGQGGRPKASDGPDSPRPSEIYLTYDELLNILFEGRELPNMHKLRGKDVRIVDREKAGYTNKGPSHLMEQKRTDEKRRGEALILDKLGKKRALGNLGEQFDILAGFAEGVESPGLEKMPVSRKEKIIPVLVGSLSAEFQPENNGEKKPEPVDLLLQTVEKMKSRLRETMDETARKRIVVLEKRLPEHIKTRENAGKLRPEHRVYDVEDDIPQPAAKAVVLCNMDVSGSMDKHKIEIAKSFFHLLYRFVNANYDEIALKFIYHTSNAEEVSEEEFFNPSKSGGTMVSSCIVKDKEVIARDFPPSEWNIYVAQASDGDNFESDSHALMKAMEELLPDVQGFFYTEIKPGGGYSAYESSLLEIYQKLAEQFPDRMFTAELKSPADALDAFKSFFPQGGHKPGQPVHHASAPAPA